MILYSKFDIWFIKIFPINSAADPKANNSSQMEFEFDDSMVEKRVYTSLAVNISFESIVI